MLLQITNVVSVIARYTVMDNLYRRWDGMALKEDYENDLKNLSYSIFTYLARAICMLYQTDGVLMDDVLKALAENVEQADAACQNFSVVVDFVENAPGAEAWDINDLTEEEDDSGEVEEAIEVALAVE